MKTFIGIDPGQAGGIAFITEQDGRPAVVEAFPMPATDQDILDLFKKGTERDLTCVFRENFALLEFVSSSPQMGVKSAFTFGQGWGVLRMALIASGIPFETVTPPVWQRAMKCLTKGDKNVSKSRAQELFPYLKITHKIADALLIAEHCRRVKGGIA